MRLKLPDRVDDFLFTALWACNNFSNLKNFLGASTSAPITSRFAPPPSGVTPPTLPSRRHRRTHQETPKLTAEALMKSQFDRENALGESTVEKLFKQTTKYPYVCNATTSKNDSAVSSSFSSDANRRTGANSAHKLAVLREEHRRENPITATILPRPERNEIGEKFDHFSEEGRKIFAELLIKKLTILSAKKKHSDAMNEQLKEIEQKKFSARDVIKANACENIAADVDDDDDVENYVKQRMIDDSMKASPSQQSPTIPMSIRSRRRSPSLKNGAGLFGDGFLGM
uniref:Uncharacterized protein n=1 Tax=Acrobeloides nanus TaxID=290746 RepID=A0A914D7N0_9BILA